MTDIYISYAREDRERVRPLVESLQFEGWDVWWDPSEPTIGGSAALDQKLGSAGAILVVWSGYSRGSEYVRSEAATGLYKNKLIQVRVDNSAPPRPFDQVDLIDMSNWMGERDDGNWRQLLSAVRLFAGAPQMAQQIPAFVPQKRKAKAPKPQKAARAPRPPSAPSAPRPSQPSRASSGYLERDRWVAPGPVIVVALALAAGAGVWFGDPFNFRGGNSTAAAETEEEAPLETAEADYTPAAGPAEAELTPAAFEESPGSERDWTDIDRTDPHALRRYMAKYPKSAGAEAARSTLRVIDAQAWVEAVTADNEKAYSAYLAKFPAKGEGAGAMTAAAEERLASLNVERREAIEEIQRGLASLDLYDGAIDGKSGVSTTKAANAFASAERRKAPSLSTAAPRELRQFANVIDVAARAATGAPASKPADPIIAAATTTTPPTAPRTTPTTIANATSATDAAEMADRKRRADAEALAAKAVAANAEDLAAAELKRAAEISAWREAERGGTPASYQAYLAAFSTGAHAAEARAAIAKLNRPAPYNLDVVTPDVRGAAEAARRNQATATSRATAARATAESAQGAPGLRTVAAANGEKFETQIANGAPNGLGTRTSTQARTAGDRYRGEIRDGVSAGLGVYEFGDNPGNTSGLVRYEGEHSQNDPNGYGVMHWKNGDTFSGLKAGAGGAQRGILTFANGQRYEGDLRNGVRDGIGVLWSSEGQVLMAGRWDNGQLAQPMAATGGSAPVSTVPAAAPSGGAPISLVPRSGG